MSVVRHAEGSPEKINLPKLSTSVQANKLKTILLERLPFVYQMAEVSSLKFSHQTVPLSTQLALQNAIERMAFPSLDEELYLAEGEALADLVALVGLLTLSALAGGEKKLNEYTPPDNPNLKIVYWGNEAFIFHKEQTDPQKYAQEIEALKSHPQISSQIKAALAGKVHHMNEKDLDKANNLAANLSGCLEEQLEKEAPKAKETTQEGVIRSAPQIPMKRLKVAVAVQAAAIRILARSMQKESARESKKLEEEMHKEREEAKEAAKEDEKIKERNFRELMKTVLKEEITRFELLRTVADEQLDINESGFVTPGRL
jgi:hypothetical protein